MRCVVFSRNRAMQLHALLESIVEYAPTLYSEIVVVYRADGPEFELGYLDLHRAWLSGPLDVEFWRQTDSFRDDLIEAVEFCEFIGFHCDDDVFYRPQPEYPTFSDNVIVSLRLGRNTIYCHPLDQSQSHPMKIALTAGGFGASWRWADAELDFGYPFSLDGHIFPGELVNDLIELLPEIASPNDFEHRAVTLMKDNAETSAWPYMGSFNHSIVVSNPVNRVNDGFPNPCDGRPEWSAETLNERWLAGERIDLAAMDFTGIVGAHQVVPLRFGGRR